MSLINISRTTAASLPSDDPLRITLEEMISRGHIGRASPIRLGDLVRIINRSLATPLTQTQWQTKVLKRTRTNSCFIGSGSRGYFIIDTIEDAQAMQAFYNARIASEQAHLNNLRNQVNTVCGWTI